MPNHYLRFFFLFIMFNCWPKSFSLHDSFPQIKSCRRAETLERGKHSLNGVNVCIIFSCDEWKCRRLNSAIESSITPLPPWLLWGGGWLSETMRIVNAINLAALTSPLPHSREIMSLLIYTRIKWRLRR